MSPRFTWPLKLWVAFTVLVLGVTGFWAARIVTGLTPAGQLGVVPESTMWGMHGCAVAILAGLGSLYSVIVAGLIVGLAMDMSVYFIPAGYRPLIAFAVVILALLIRPEGLSGKARS